jgi:VanZ family protein
MVPRPLRLAVFVLACAIVTWASLAPSSALPSVTLWDKIEHLTAYFGLTVIGAYAFPNRLSRLAAGLFGAGVAIEVAQSMMGWGRQGDPADALANTVGIALGLLAVLALRALIKVKAPARGE